MKKSFYTFKRRISLFLTLLSIGCTSDYSVRELEQGNAVKAYNDLNGDQLSFTKYCGAVNNVSGFVGYPETALGTVWQRDFCCREDIECNSCGFIPDFQNFNTDNLQINKSSSSEELFSMNVTYSDGLSSGLFTFLGNEQFQETSIINITATIDFEGEVVNDEGLEQAIENFEYGDSNKEQAYAYSHLLIKVLSREYMLFKENTQVTGSEILLFGDKYYYDSGLFKVSHVSNLCVRPFRPSISE